MTQPRVHAEAMQSVLEERAAQHLRSPRAGVEAESSHDEESEYETSASAGVAGDHCDSGVGGARLVSGAGVKEAAPLQRTCIRGHVLRSRTIEGGHSCDVCHGKIECPAA